MTSTRSPKVLTRELNWTNIDEKSKVLTRKLSWTSMGSEQEEKVDNHPMQFTRFGVSISVGWRT